jgi:hypothetical protein
MLTRQESLGESPEGLPRCQRIAIAMSIRSARRSRVRSTSRWCPAAATAAAAFRLAERASWDGISNVRPMSADRECLTSAPGAFRCCATGGRTAWSATAAAVIQLPRRVSPSPTESKTWRWSETTGLANIRHRFRCHEPTAGYPVTRHRDDRGSSVCVPARRTATRNAPAFRLHSVTIDTSRTATIPSHIGLTPGIGNGSDPRQGGDG